MSTTMLPVRRALVTPPRHPRINQAHAGAPGLTLWLATQPMHLIGANTLVASTELSYSANSASQFGVGRKWSRVANAGIDFGTLQLIRQNSGVTVLVCAAPVASTALKVPFSQRIGGGSYTQTDLAFNSSVNGLGASSGSLAMINYHGGDAGVVAANQCDGKPHCWVVSNSTTQGYVYRDGIAQTLSTSIRSTTLTGSTQKLRIGNIADDASTTYPCDDPVYMVAVWDRQLHPELAMSISMNPWQLLQRNAYSFIQTGGINLYSLGYRGVSLSTMALSTRGNSELGVVSVDTSAKSAVLAALASAGYASIDTVDYAPSLYSTGGLGSANVGVATAPVQYILADLNNLVQLGLATVSVVGRGIQYNTPFGTIEIVFRDLVDPDMFASVHSGFGVKHDGTLCIIV